MLAVCLVQAICAAIIVWLTTLLFSHYDRLSSADIVLTTYNLVQREVQLPESLKKNKHEQEKAACEDEVSVIMFSTVNISSAVLNDGLAD